MVSEEATTTNFRVFGLTRSGLEPTIYSTEGEHANNYTTASVSDLWLNRDINKKKNAHMYLNSKDNFLKSF